MAGTPATSKRTPQMSWELLFQITDLLRVLGAPGNMLNNKKITLGKIRVISYLFANMDQPPMLKDIASVFGLTPGAVSQTIDALVEDGIVRRVQSKVDRRAVYISLTRQGVALKRRHDNYFTDYMDHFFRNIDEKKQEAFMEVLEQMVETLRPEVGKQGEIAEENEEFDQA